MIISPLLAAPLMALGSAILVSLVSFIGAAVLPVQKAHWIHRLVGLAVGALFGDAFIHLLPEAYETTKPSFIVSIGVIIGILLFFILSKFLHWQHHHNGHHHQTKSFGYSILIGDALHNFIDGILIGAAYLASIPLGIATTIAIVVHEIPQEIGDFGVLLSAGYTRKQALLFNFLSALTAVTGTALVIIIGQDIQQITQWLLPIAAGGFIYIAGTDLVPELHKQPPRVAYEQLLFICFGLLAMIALLFLKF